LIIKDALTHAHEFGELSLYVHIPFCVKKCDYCDFYSQTEIRKELIDAYVNNVCREIDHLSDIYAKAFYTIFIGGGNPGLLGVENLLRIVHASSKNGSSQEMTIEMNPDTLNLDMLENTVSYIDRISLGVQSLHTKNLLMIGRNTTRERTLSGLSAFSSFRDNFSLNIDLIQGIPEQGFTDTIEDIEQIYSLVRPDHLSLYDLIIEDGTPLKKRLYRQGKLHTDNNGNVLIDIASSEELLRSLGYSHYEISNYAQPDKECLHNSHYWKMLPYIGIGAGAVSTLYTEEGPMRITGSKNMLAYAYENTLFSDKIYTANMLSAKEFLEEILIMGLRTDRGVSLGRVKRIFGMDLLKLLETSLQTWNERGCITSTEKHLAVTKEGMRTLNTILIDMFVDIDSYEGSYHMVLDTSF